MPSDASSTFAQSPTTLIDQLIAAWTDYEQQRMPSGTPNGQRAELRAAFFTGASSMAALRSEACNAKLTLAPNATVVRARASCM